jgi:hypothetical protein
MIILLFLALQICWAILSSEVLHASTALWISGLITLFVVQIIALTSGGRS